jgi:hypothetical protein
LVQKLFSHTDNLGLRGHLAISRKHFDFHNLGSKNEGWLLASVGKNQILLNFLQCTWQPPTTQNSAAQNVSVVEAENPGLGPKIFYN